MVKTCFQLSFANDFQEGKMGVNKILRHLKYELPELTEDVLFDLRIIYSELIINGIIHGNQKDYSKKVHLYVEVETDMIISVVRDEGAGFNHESLRSAPRTGDLFSDQGRGLRIVFSLADLVEWNEIGNEVTFCKRI